MKTELSKTINPEDQGRISEDEMTPVVSMSVYQMSMEVDKNIGYMDALHDVCELLSTELTIDQKLRVLGLKRK